MIPLTLPGTIPGLLRRGSPCRRLTLGDPVMQEPVLVHAVAVRAHWTDESATEPCAEIRSGPLTWWPCRALALDLSDPTGRAHAGWWWRLALHPDLSWRANPEWGGVYSLAGFAVMPELAPVVAHLDLNDPRLLPDGSRWVDAEALRLVCLHVAGVSP
jgi:hypothetical protein